MKEKLHKIKYYILAGLFVVVFFFFGLYLGDHNRPEIDKVLGVTNKETQVSTSVDFSPFWKVWNLMNEKSPTVGQISDQDKVYGAIAGLVSSLNDPYSVYFNPQQTKDFEDQISGNFDGVGIEVGMKNNILTVIAPLKDTPAYRANIKAGDEILKIDQQSTSDISIDQALNLIRGQKGTSVTLTILHANSQQPVEIKLVRDTIDIPTLDTQMRKDGIFVISLYSFDANAANLFRNAMQQFVNSGSDKLIIDLRGNPGGYLDAAVDMASWFLKSDKVVVTEDYGGNKTPDVYKSKGYDIFDNPSIFGNKKLKLVVLIDGGSASASEILAGALQDNGVAKLVGAQSFGKGSVQEVVNVTPDTILKITVARWLTPNGTSISEKGLTPDYPVSITQSDIDSGKDPQMDKAVQLLNS